MIGIYVNNAHCFADLIINGSKVYETRNRNTLKKFIGTRVAIVKTGNHKKPVVIGFVNIMGVLQSDWIVYRRMAYIYGTEYDCKQGEHKYFYRLESPVKITPFPLPSNTIRHGRIFCDF